MRAPSTRSWGHDFRVDYFFIADFIRDYEKEKGNDCRIAVSCFTATAKRKVIQDIFDYFKTTLNLDLERFETFAVRKNLHYSVLEVDNDKAKYERLRELLDQRKGPAIIYVSTVGRTYEISERLQKDGFAAVCYNGRLQSQDKRQNQEDFLSNKADIMVATNAFGMGVDKPDVRLVVHYDIASSLENYIQEAGRAARDEHLSADCCVLFCDEDLNRIFSILVNGHLSLKEIKDIWKAVKIRSKGRKLFACSSLELARAAGWSDEEIENGAGLETKVKTALAALERAGYIKREMNAPRIYATGLKAQSVIWARKRIEESAFFESEELRERAVRICSSLISAHNTYKMKSADAESRVDHLADRLGFTREEVVACVTKLKQSGILDDDPDMTALLEGNVNLDTLKGRCKNKLALERFLFHTISASKEKRFSLKELNTAAQNERMQTMPKDLMQIFVFWRLVEKIKFTGKNGDGLEIDFDGKAEKIRRHLEMKTAAANKIIDAIYAIDPEEIDEKGRKIIHFSAIRLLEIIRTGAGDLFEQEDMVKIQSVEDVNLILHFLQQTELLTLEGGFLVLYNAMMIRKCVTNSQIQYKKEDYKTFNTHFHQRIEQVHIVERYANLLLSNYEEALEYVRDYFRMDYKMFIHRYFSEEEIKRMDDSLTVSKYDQLFGKLSDEQRKVIEDKATSVAVAAGPGSGKTRVLVCKLASLLLLEETRREQLLMLTFSRAAAGEFRQRLVDLVGPAAYGVEIKTFHSYSFDLIGRLGSSDEFKDVVCRAAEAIRNGLVIESFVTKSVLVLDEAQDMSADEYALVEAIEQANPGMRIVAVGDDDQNIYAFRGSDSRYFIRFAQKPETSRHLLPVNYRSATSIVEFANAYAGTIEGRLKDEGARANRKDLGSVVLTSYANENLEVPMAQEIIEFFKKDSRTKGSNRQISAVLTPTNEQALRMYSLLAEAGLKVRLIATWEKINAYNVLEMRTLLNILGYRRGVSTVGQTEWRQAREKLDDKFSQSCLYPYCRALLDNFEKELNWSEETCAEIFYLSDLEAFLRESDLFDALQPELGTVIVSTMHKAKGREFDNVWVMIDRRFADRLWQNDFQERNQYRRTLYVAMTRAKSSLFVHHVGRLFKNVCTSGLVRRRNEKTYLRPRRILVNFGYEDINLGRFDKNNKRRIVNLRSGMPLEYQNGIFYVREGGTLKPVAWLSKKGRAEFAQLEKQNYRLTGAEVAVVVAWRNKERETEEAVVLPNLRFEKIV